jgi:hypothetical protein
MADLDREANMIYVTPINGFRFTCPYCLTVIDSAEYPDLYAHSAACYAHMKACREHAEADAVRAALVRMTDKRDNQGRPIYAVPGRD